MPSFSLNQSFLNCGTRTTSGTRRLSRWYTNRPTFCFSRHENYIHSYNFTDWVLLINSWIFVYFPCWLWKWPQKFSQPFCSCQICVKSCLPNFWSNNIWKIKFSWSKVVRDDSTEPTNGTRSGKVWEPLH